VLGAWKNAAGQRELDELFDTSASLDGVAHAYTLRATQIHRREDGAWKVAHRHASAPPA
jgi:ketosteroid isomerase-like protein